MKALWTKFSDSFAGFHDLFSEYIKGVNDKKSINACKILLGEYYKLVKLHNEFDRLVEPIPPVEIKMPFESEKFAQEWNLYKENLEERFGIYTTSRNELMMLRRLARLAENDEEKAILMLEFFMCHRHKSIYKPTREQLEGQDIATQSEDT